MARAFPQYYPTQIGSLTRHLVIANIKIQQEIVICMHHIMLLVLIFIFRAEISF